MGRVAGELQVRPVQPVGQLVVLFKAEVHAGGGEVEEVHHFDPHLAGEFHLPAGVDVVLVVDADIVGGVGHGDAAHFLAQLCKGGAADAGVEGEDLVAIVVFPVQAPALDAVGGGHELFGLLVVALVQPAEVVFPLDLPGDVPVMGGLALAEHVAAHGHGDAEPGLKGGAGPGPAIDHQMPAAAGAGDEVGQQGDGALGDGGVGGGVLLAVLVDHQLLLVRDLIAELLGRELAFQLHGEFHALQAGAAVAGGPADGLRVFLHILRGQGIEFGEKHAF